MRHLKGYAPGLTRVNYGQKSFITLAPGDNSPPTYLSPLTKQEPINEFGVIKTTFKISTKFRALASLLGLEKNCYKM